MCEQHQEYDDVFILHDHFVKRCKDKIEEGGYHGYLKRIGKIYHYILEHYLIKDLNGVIELCFNHFMKCLVNRHKFRPMMKQINPGISRKIITNMTKYLDPPSMGTSAGPQIS